MYLNFTFSLPTRSYFNFLEDSSDSGSEDEEVSSCTHQVQTNSCHLSSLTQIDTINVYGTIPLFPLELEGSSIEGSPHRGALKSFGKFVRKYFLCISKEHFEGQEDEVTSESVDISQGTPQFRRPSTQSSSRAKQQRDIRRHRFNSVSKVFSIDFHLLNVIYCLKKILDRQIFESRFPAAVFCHKHTLLDFLFNSKPKAVN